MLWPGLNGTSLPLMVRVGMASAGVREAGAVRPGSRSGQCSRGAEGPRRPDRAVPRSRSGIHAGLRKLRQRRSDLRHLARPNEGKSRRDEGEIDLELLRDLAPIAPQLPAVEVGLGSKGLLARGMLTKPVGLEVEDVRSTPGARLPHHHEPIDDPLPHRPAVDRDEAPLP
ncbi:MAG: hypothetical protein ACO3EP_12360, partial [Phycisphaerales bacterium]